MTTLLQRYILVRAAILSGGALAALVAVVWVVQVLQRVDLVRTTATAAGDIFFIAALLLPDLAAGVLPFALLIGAVQALNGLNNDSERTVMAAAGASRMIVAKPIMALSLAAGVLILLNSHFVGPVSSSAFQNSIRTINADAITLFLRPGRFEQVQDGLVISVGESRGTRVRNLFLADSRDPTLDLAYFADEANVVERDGRSYLVLDDGQLHRRTNETGAVSIIEFQTYAFDLANLRPVETGDWIRMSERSTAELMRPDPNDRLFQTDPGRFVEELALRRTDWLYALAFGLWAVVVAGQPRTNRQGAGPAMAIGLGGALILKALGFVSLALVDLHPRFVALVYAVPVVSLVVSGYLFWRDTNVLEWPLVRRTSDALHAMREWTSRKLRERRSLSGGSPA